MYGHWKPYVPVAQRRKNAEKSVSKLVKKGLTVSPVAIDGRTIAKSFWGKAWCEHLESLGDYENRLPRGRTYVRNGSVVHLAIESGKISALVSGSTLYEIEIEIKTVSEQKWQAIAKNCSGQVGSMIELLQGKLSSGVMQTITNQNDGLFPLAKEISLKCSCPDWATMCKHVAAVLYGVGARLDNEPELLFKLRNVDHTDLIEQVSLSVPTQGRGKVIQDQDLSSLFGIDIVDDAEAPAPVKKVAVKKVVAKKDAKEDAKGGAKEKVGAVSVKVKKTPAKTLKSRKPKTTKAVTKKVTINRSTKKVPAKKKAAVKPKTVKHV